MKINFLFAWYDIWIGVFYDKHKNWLYILPLPMLGVIIKLPIKRYWIYSTSINRVVGSTTKDEIDYIAKEGKKKFIPYWAKNGTVDPWLSNNLDKDD